MPEKRKPGTEGGRKSGCSIKNARRIPPAPPPSSRYSDSPTDDASPPPRCTRSIPCRPIVFPDGISVPGEMGEYIATFFPLQRGSVSFQISSHGERVWSGISQVGGQCIIILLDIQRIFPTAHFQPDSPAALPGKERVPESSGPPFSKKMTGKKRCGFE